MEIKIVSEMFTVFDGRGEGFEMLEPVRQFPFVLIRFLVRSDCYAENLDGQIIFRRTYQKQFNRVKAQLIAEFLSIYDDNSTTDLPIIEQITPWLRQHLTEDFLVPDKIELDAISILGSWDIFIADHTKMGKEFYKQIERSMENLPKSD